MQTILAKTNLHKIEIRCDEIATYFDSLRRKRIILVRWMSLYLWDSPLAGAVLRLNNQRYEKRTNYLNHALNAILEKKLFIENIS
jgi:hypothetical protein